MHISLMLRVRVARVVPTTHVCLFVERPFFQKRTTDNLQENIENRCQSVLKYIEITE